MLHAAHATREMGLLCKRRACEAGEYNTATIQRQRHSCHGPSEEVRVVSCALFAFRTIFSKDSYLDWLGQTAFTAVCSLTEYLCAGDSILDGRLYMFSSQGCNRDMDVGAGGKQLDLGKH